MAVARISFLHRPLTARGGTDGGAMGTSRARAPAANPVGDDETRSLLDRYRCPVPFHVVRARLLGNIASPDMTRSPMDPKVPRGHAEPVPAAPEEAGGLLRGVSEVARDPAKPASADGGISGLYHRRIEYR